MILTCPECATSFKAPENAIGPNGRTVRCSKCNTTWFVAAEPDILALDDEMKEVIASKHEEEAAPEEARANKKQKDDFSSNIQQDDIDAGLDSKQDERIAPLSPHAMIREKSERKKMRKRLLGVGMIWVVTLGLLAFMALAAYLFRAQIVQIFPGTAPVYKAFGLEANAMGLKFYDVKTKYGTNEGVKIFIVNGRIKNFDRKTRQLELIKFSFKNAAGEIITSWVIEPPKNELKPGESVKFAAQYPNPPIDAAVLVQEFVDEMQGEAVPDKNIGTNIDDVNNNTIMAITEDKNPKEQAD